MKFWAFCLRFEGVAIEKEIGNILFAVFAATRDAFLASYAIFRREVLSVSAGSSLRQSRLRSSSSHRCRMTNFQACPQQNCWFEFRSIRPTANLLRSPNFRFFHHLCQLFHRQNILHHLPRFLDHRFLKHEKEIF